jgi:hypothetical protein
MQMGVPLAAKLVVSDRDVPAKGRGDVQSSNLYDEVVNNHRAFLQPVMKRARGLRVRMTCYHRSFRQMLT